MCHPVYVQSYTDGKKGMYPGCEHFLPALAWLLLSKTYIPYLLYIYPCIHYISLSL